MREEYSTTIELHEKILILERIKILKEHITEKYKQGCNSFKQEDINILDKFAWNVWCLTQQEIAKVESYIY